jgi:hypothetical protein
MSATPTPYDRQANFVTDAQGNANITVSQIATELDAEFNAINVSLDQTQSRLAQVQRDDGQLYNQIVTSSSLAPEVLSLLGANNALFKGNWATGIAYVVGNSVVANGAAYYCVTAHTSGTFATDLANGLWIIPSTVPADGTISTAKLADGSVTTAKIANGAIIAANLASNSVTTAKIVDGAVTAAKIDPNAKIGGATGNGTDRVFYENDQTVTSNYTITTNKNAMSAGPITVSNGISVTVPSGSTYTIV